MIARLLAVFFRLDQTSCNKSSKELSRRPVQWAFMFSQICPTLHGRASELWRGDVASHMVYVSSACSFVLFDQSNLALVLDTPSRFNVTYELNSWKNTKLPGLARGSLVWSRVSGT